MNSWVFQHLISVDLTLYNISRVTDQNGVSLLYVMLLWSGTLDLFSSLSVLIRITVASSVFVCVCVLFCFFISVSNTWIYVFSHVRLAGRCLSCMAKNFCTGH